MQREYSFNVNGILVKGSSISGYGTALVLPAHGVCFDMGALVPSALPCAHVAISHGHDDHIGAVIQHASIRAMNRQAPPTYYTRARTGLRLRGLLTAGEEITEGPLPANVVTAWPDDPDDASAVCVEVPAGKNRVLRAFATHHRIVSQGYTLFDVRRKLRPAYAGLTGPEIAAVRERGECVTEDVYVPIFTYTGDTSSRVFDTMPEWAWRAKVIACECTYLGSGASVEKARERGHIHLDEIAARADAIAARMRPGARLLLYHFSRRYTNRQIAGALGALPPPARALCAFFPVPAGTE